jgi:phosphopantetheinyl transferase
MTSGAVILADFDHVPASVIDYWLSAMSPATRKRAMMFSSPRRFRQFVAGRWLLATLLADRMGITPCIVESSSREPQVANADVHCSIAHSGNAVMAGFSVEAPIGVDIEQHRQRDVERLVMTYFHSDEQRFFADLDKDARLSWFYRIWTCKEAHAKASGQGLTLKHLAQSVLQESKTETVDTYFLDNHTASIAHQSTARVTARFMTDWGKGTRHWQLLHPSTQK